MTGIVYTRNRHKGMRIIKELVGDNVLNGNNCIRYNSGPNTYVEFKNGDIWRLFGPEHSARGYKWDYCFIETAIDIDTINQKILPSAKIYHFDSPEAKIPMERRVSYF